MTVIEHDQITVSLEPLCKKNCSLEDGAHGRSRCSRDLDAVVRRERVELRIALTAEILDDFAVHRPRQRALHAADVDRRFRTARLLLRQDVDEPLEPLRFLLQLAEPLLRTTLFPLTSQ